MPQARAARDTLSESEGAQIDVIVHRLELDPWGDDQTKFTVIMRGWAAGVYDDGHWELVYRIIDSRFIEIVGISRVGS